MTLRTHTARPLVQAKIEFSKVMYQTALLSAINSERHETFPHSIFPNIHSHRLTSLLKNFHWFYSSPYHHSSLIHHHTMVHKTSREAIVLLFCFVIKIETNDPKNKKCATTCGLTHEKKEIQPQPRVIFSLFIL